MNPRYLVWLFWLVSAGSFAQQPSGFPDNFHPEYFQFPDYQEGTDCLPKTVIIKLKPGYRNALEPASDNALLRFIRSAGIAALQKKFPLHKPPVRATNSIGQELTDLSLIYELVYTSDMKLPRVVNEVIATGMVEYAQPHFIDRPMEDPLRTLWTPNDTSIGLQWYLGKMGVLSAWDLDTGNASVIIAVVDGGTNFAHPDLTQNIYYNTADPVDGTDNDNDGYIDNYQGWDVGDGDNIPQFIGPFNSAHGTAMCGLAGGSSNNVAGIAGVSYKCRYMPVKIVNSSLGWSAGYDGIVYAADHGAAVISCSWGGNAPQPYAYDVVRYAMVNRGAQIIAAAGNSNNTVPFYPASYEGVIAIGGTTSTDQKSANSSYYEYVDVMAPGQMIYETYATGYTYGHGTSDATAIASGGFGLVQSRFPSYTPHQVGALLVQSAYRVDTIPVNAPYAGKMGSGRLDIFNAFTMAQKPFIYFYSRTYTDGADNIVSAGDTVTLTGNYLNYLAASTGALSATISTTSPHLQILDSTSGLGVLSTLSSLQSHPDGFRFLILPSCPANQDILFRITFSDGARLNTQYFTITVNPQFYNVRVNGLHTTITNTGRLGFFNSLSTQGVGYRLNGGDNQLLGVYYHPMGFWAGAGGKVSNQTITSPITSCCPFESDNHFVQVSPIRRVLPPVVADLELVSNYNDNGAGANRLDLEVLQKTYAWGGSAADSNFILLEYQLLNTGASGLSDVYAGIFSDFDMPDSLYSLLYNKAYYDTAHTMGVTYNPGGEVLTGVKVVSSQPVSYYAFNSDGTGGSFTLYDGFSQPEKWSAMSGGIQRPASGITDVAQFIGVKIDSIAPGGCATVVFALLIGTDTASLHASSLAAYNRYQATYNMWTGNGGNSDWHNAANWSKGAVPTYSDHVIVPDTRSTGGLSPVISGADAVAGNMEIRCGGDVQLINNRKLFVGN